MKQVLKTSAIITVTALSTYLATDYFYVKNMRQDVIKAMIPQTIEINAFNDVWRVESFDRLEEFIKKGCTKEVFQLIEVERSIVLTGIGSAMRDNEKIQKIIKERNQNISERAQAELKIGNPPRATPQCN